MENVKQFYPQDHYEKKGSIPLNKYGNGPFCRFSLKSKDYFAVSGVYALFDDNGLLYIGQTENLEQRFNTGYGTIAPRNCYAGGQNTNCKINNMVLNKYLNGQKVYLYFLATADYFRIEQELIFKLRPEYNGSLKSLLPLRKTHNDTYEKLQTGRHNITNYKKYDMLYNHLSIQTVDKIVLSFVEIERIVGEKLPASAHRYPAWWSNSTTPDHPHCRAWLDAKYKTIDVCQTLSAKRITFARF